MFVNPIYRCLTNTKYGIGQSSNYMPHLTKPATSLVDESIFDVMLFISWNINGLAKRFEEVKQLLYEYAPDFLCLQKVRYNAGRDRFTIDGYHQLFALQDYGDWSGVSIYAKLDSVTTVMPERIETPELSLNGHLQAFDCKSFAVINTYVPFGNNSLEGAVEYRRQWDTAFRIFVKRLSSRIPVIICGDMNIVHTEYDNFEGKLE